MNTDLQHQGNKRTTRFKDFLWAAILGCIAFGLFYPGTQSIVISTTKQHPYVMGFIKFAILATMGELLAIRMIKQEWENPPGVVYRAIVWGVIGAGLVVIFGVFANGVEAVIKQGLVPAGNDATARTATALWISIINNLAFAPTLMLAHRITDTYIDLAGGQFKQIKAVQLAQVVEEIDWRGFFDFVIFKTIPFFWIPAHTITFLLPPEYRILFAAFLSIAFGGILAFAKRKPQAADDEGNEYAV